ncbi:MAG: SRPBCC family protein [Candidatus Dormibacteria bacterium]
MTTIQRRIRFHAPLERVWDAFHGDPELSIAWAKSFSRIRRTTPGPAGLHSTVLFAVRLPGRGEFEYEIAHTGWRRLREVRWEFISGLSGHGHYRYTRTRTARPGTLLDFEINYQLPGGPLGMMLNSLVVQQHFEAGVDSDLRSLDEWLASGHRVL